MVNPEGISSSEAISATVVTCVEAGPLEEQTCRMVQSLRNWGGAMAQLPVIAVTPRWGPPIANKTRDRYDTLGIEYINAGRSESKYAWFPYLNKPVALVRAEQACKTDTIIWLDADVLVVREPRELLMGPEEDWTACPTEKNIGSEGPGDEYHGYWIAMCQELGMNLSDVPILTEFRSGRPIYSYYNAGIFSYRRTVGYGQMYLDSSVKLLDAKIKIPKDGVAYHEQAALGLIALKNKLRMRILDESCNYHFGSTTSYFVKPETFRQAKVLHYHRSMQADRWRKFVDMFTNDYPQVKAWLEPLGPLGGRQPAWKRAIGKVQRKYRKRLADSYLATCRTV